MSIIIILSCPTVLAQSGWYNIQVGVYGAQDSVGNIGVSVAIRTNIYSAQANEADVFWVGSNLVNGAFIQFGYGLEPGTFCDEGYTINGQDTCVGSVQSYGANEAYWFWQYWPTAYGSEDFYYGNGQPNSVGSNGTWRTYAIVGDGSSWSFLVNNNQVDRVPFQPVPSKSEVEFIVEKGTYSASQRSRLGPVEFRNLSYLKKDGWHLADDLTAYVGCGAISTNCNLDPYGVSVDGPGGYLIAGSGIKQPNDGDTVWSGKAIDYPILPILTILPTSVPCGCVSVILDGTHAVNGTAMDFQLERGTHSIALNQVLISSGSDQRFHFDHWSDEITQANRTLDLESDTTLQAIFVMQYKVTITSAFISGVNSTWLDEGSTIKLTAPPPQELTGLWGLLGAKLIFDGWEEDGQLISKAVNLSILLYTPHSIYIRGRVDYTNAEMLLSGLVALTAVLVILIVLVGRKSKR
jgi:hypothetical protein